jgi:hypothetical protein
MSGRVSRTRRCSSDLLDRRERPKWRFVGADHLQAWKPTRQPCLEFQRHAVGAAVKEMAKALLCRTLADIQHQVRTVNAGHLLEAPQLAAPDHRHAIGRA